MTNLPIPIPQGFKLQVKEDQKISAGDTIAVKEDFSSDLLINIAQDLGIDPKKVPQSLSKKPGDRVEAGDLIAKKGGILGSREIHSRVSGTIVKLSEEEGTIVVRTDSALNEDSQIKISSPVDGIVISCDNDKVVLKTDKETILAEKGSGETGFGETLVISQEVVDQKEIDDKVSGKILIAKSITREAAAKAIGLGALGIISQKVSGEYIESLREKMIKTPVLTVSPEGYKKISGKHGKIIADANNLAIVIL